MSKYSELAERLDRVAEFGGTHLDGLWTEAAAALRELEAERDTLRGRIGCGCGGDYGLCELCSTALEGE